MNPLIVRTIAAVASFALGIGVVRLADQNNVIYKEPKTAIGHDGKPVVIGTLTEPFISNSDKCEDWKKRLEIISFDTSRHYATVTESRPGLLDERVLCKPAPVIPQNLKDRKYFGTLKVQILVDCNGRVKQAHAFTRDIAVRVAIEDAARQARSLPQLLGGEVVNVSGVLTYNFVPQLNP